MAVWNTTVLKTVFFGGGGLKRPKNIFLSTIFLGATDPDPLNNGKVVLTIFPDEVS